MNWLEIVVPLLLSVVSLIVHAIVAHRVKCEKNALDCLREDLPAVLDSFNEEVLNLYKKQEERKTNPENFSQSFTPYSPEYVYNPATRELELVSATGKNDQAKIDSFIEFALDRILARFSDSAELYRKSVKADDDEDVVADYSSVSSDLGALGDAFDIAEDYREKFGLADSMSFSDIMKFVGDRAAELKTKLERKPVVNVEEGSKDEKKD